MSEPEAISEDFMGMESRRGGGGGGVISFLAAGVLIVLLAFLYWLFR